MTLRYPPHLLLLLLLLSATAYMTWFCLHEGFASFGSDSGSYLLLARKWSPWFGASPAELSSWPVQSYPPVWPALLALTGASGSLWWSHLLALTFLPLSLLLAWRWFSPALGQNATLALCALYLLLPGTLINSMPISAENSFLLLSLATLYWHSRSPAQQREYPTGADKKPALFSRDLVLWMLLSLSILNRSIGLALLPALLLARPTLRQLLTCLAALLSVALWAALDPQAHLPGYLAILKDLSWQQYHAVLQINLARLPGAWYQIIAGPAQSTPAWVLSLMVLAVLLFYTLRRAAKGAVDALYCVGYLLILLIWPFPTDDRFLQPVVLLLLVQPFAAVGRRALPLYALLLLPVVLGQAEVLQRAMVANQTQQHSRDYYHLASPDEAQVVADQFSAIYQHMRHSGELLPETSTVATVKPAFFVLLAQRHAVPLYPAAATPGECPPLPKAVSHLLFTVLTSGYNQLGIGAIENYRPFLPAVWVLEATPKEAAAPAMLATLASDVHTKCPSEEAI